MVGNIITSPTFRFLKVNDVEIEDKNIPISRWNGQEEIEDVSKLEDAFKDVKFGVSKELVEKNIQNANSKIHLSLTNEQEKHIKYEFTKDNKILLDDIRLQTDKDSKSKVIIDYINGDNDIKTYRNSVTQIYASDNSALDLYIITRQSSSDDICHSIGIITGENAQINLYQVELGFKFKAISVNSFLKGKNSRVNIQGIYLTKDEERLDLLYNSTITGEKCKSHIKLHGVQKDNSHKTFKGTIDFKRGSRGSVGDEGEYVTLLDDGVVSRSLPILLCTEEDVRGNHAASVGKLDQSMLFYIMSRGLSLEEATNLVIMAGLSPVIDKIPAEDIREDIAKKIENIILG